MKKILAVLLVLAMTLALAACGGSMNVFLQLLKEEENNEA